MNVFYERGIEVELYSDPPNSSVAGNVVGPVLDRRRRFGSIDSHNLPAFALRYVLSASVSFTTAGASSSWLANGS